MARKTAFIYSDGLSRHTLSDTHPMKPVRLRYTYELLDSYGAFDAPNVSVVTPREALDSEIMLYHTPEYIDAVRRLNDGDATVDQLRFNFGPGDNPAYEGIYDASALSTGATLTAVEMLLSDEADAAFSISGGLHHAMPAYAYGFCVFNDPVVAINYLLGKGRRVVYVDIDAHHGDGVQAAFYDTDKVLTISLHESGMFLFPGTGGVEEMGVGAGEGYSINLPLYPGTDDQLYLRAFREVVPPLIDAFKPDVIATQLGIDTYHTDPLTHLMLSSVGFEQAVGDFAAMGIPWLAFGGGGYDLGAVARCWTLAYGVMLEREWPNDLPGTYVGKYGGRHLRDSPDSVAAIPEHIRLQAESFADNSVRMLKEQVFPIHGIK